MALFRKRITFAEVGFLLMAALKTRMQNQSQTDLDRLEPYAEWGDVQRLYEELQYLRATSIEIAIQNILPEPLDGHILSEFRRVLEEAAASTGKNEFPIVSVYEYRLAQYEAAATRCRDIPSTIINLGKTFVTICALDDNLDLASMAALEFVAMQGYIKTVLTNLNRDYKFVA